MIVSNGLRKKIARLSLGLMTVFASGCVSSGKYNDLNEQHTKTTQDLRDLEENHRALENRAREQQVYIAELENRLGKGASDKAKLESSLAETRRALEELTKRKAETERRIAEYTDLVRKFQTLVDAGRLSVRIIDGRMVVVMASDVLFPSGSAKLSADGQNSVKEVAELLATFPDRLYQIEGHTDNVPIQTAQFPSNWELASARAQTVLSTMLSAGMNPERLSAASFGQYKPAQSNATKEGRAANRRIEIVIVPDLSGLPGYEELQKYSISDRRN